MTLTALECAINRHRTERFQRERNDWYVEPAWCWSVLESTAPWLFTGTVLDPCCGGGTGLEWCRARGIRAIGSDIVDRGAGACIADFLAPDYPWRAESVICNPPYKYAVEFAYKALEVAERSVALLVQLPFLASQRRFHLFAGTPVAGVIILSKRPSMPPGGVEAGPQGGKEDYCWIIWRHGYEGEPAIHWAMPGGATNLRYPAIAPGGLG